MCLTHVNLGPLREGVCKFVVPTRSSQCTSTQVSILQNQCSSTRGRTRWALTDRQSHQDCSVIKQAIHLQWICLVASLLILFWSRVQASKQSHVNITIKHRKSLDEKMGVRIVLGGNSACSVRQSKEPRPVEQSIHGACTREHHVQGPGWSCCSRWRSFPPGQVMRGVRPPVLQRALRQSNPHRCRPSTSTWVGQAPSSEVACIVSACSTWAFTHTHAITGQSFV